VVKPMHEHSVELVWYMLSGTSIHKTEN